MLHQVNMEALYSATYVENYLDCVENFPNELQRLISRMRELDVYYLGKTCFRKHFFDSYLTIFIIIHLQLAYEKCKINRKTLRNVQTMFKKTECSKECNKL